MKLVLVGSRYSARRCSRRCAGKKASSSCSVVAPAADDRLALAARAAGVAGARAREPEGRARRGDPRGHRPHRRRPHACARERRGAGALAARRHRLSPVAAAAPSRHRRGRVDDPRRRPDRRRLGLSPGRRLGRRRDRRAGLVLRRARARRRASCGSARSRRWACALLGRGRAPRARPRRAAGAAAGRALRDARADDPPRRRADRGQRRRRPRRWSSP